MSNDVQEVGSGTVVGFAETVTGLARHIDGVQTVVELMNGDVSGTILVVEDAAATSVAPIIGDAAGLVCTSGGPTSHLALVSKEFGVPCIMAASVPGGAAALDGVQLTMGADGSLTAG